MTDAEKKKFDKTKLAFITEVGVYGSMPIKDPTVQEVTECTTEDIENYVKKLKEDDDDKN